MAGTVKPVLETTCIKRPPDLTLSQTSPFFTCLQYNSFENTVGKGEIARNEQFLLFPTVFFYPVRELSAIFIKFKVVVCKPFLFCRV